MRSFLKKEDGLLDLIVKIVTIAAFVFAVHQYVYKIYPVWSKENKLIEVSKSLEEKQSHLKIVSSDLKAAEYALSEKTNEVQAALSRLKSIESEYMKRETKLSIRIKSLIDSANEERKKYAAEKSRMDDDLRVARHEIESKNSEMVGVYLDKYAHDIHLIQIDNIRWSKGSENLDLKKDIFSYVEEKMESAKKPAQKIALEIFRLFAEKEIEEGHKDYSKAVMVGVFYRVDEEAQLLIKSIKNA